MPKHKRSSEEELQRCYKKLKRLEKKIKDGESSKEGGGRCKTPEGKNPETQTIEGDVPKTLIGDETETSTGATENPEGDTVVEVIDPEVLLILGDPAVETPKFGPKISNNLANRWTPILKKGISKEEKENIYKLYQVPSNCVLLQSPAINPEIGSAISEAAKNRDKRLESAQQQLGVGLTALGRAMTLAITNWEGEKIQIIKHMNDAAKILTDLHFNETKGRKHLITPTLDKSFLDLVKEVEHDEFLYGKDISEKIKTLKTIERSSQSIKKTEQAKTAQTYASTSKQIQKGNFNNPPRYNQRFSTPFRGTARGGFKRPLLPPRRPAPPSSSQPPPKKDTPRAPR